MHMIKRLIFATIGLCFVLIFFALVAPIFISGETYKNQIKSAVENATGRTLNIEGKLSVRFFPTASIVAEKVSLSNPKGFDDKKPFMSLSSLDVEVAIFPLIDGKVVIKNFVLQEPVIHLQSTLDGKKNWIFASKRTDPSKDEADENQPPERPKIANPRMLPANVILKNFEIKDGTILLTKGCCEPAFELKKLNTTVVLQSSASAAAINGNAQWNGKTIDIKGGVGTLESLIAEQKMEVKLTLKSDVFELSVDGNYDKGGFSGRETSSSPSLKDLIAWVAPGKPISTPAKLAFESTSEIRCGFTYCNLASLDLTLDALNAKGSIKSTFTDIKPLIEINLSTANLDLNAFLPQNVKTGAAGNLFIADAFAQGTERFSSEPIDLSALGSVNATTTIRAENVTYGKIHLSKVVMNSKLQQGVLTADISNAVLYKGTGSLLLKVSANQVPAALESGFVLKSVALEPFLADLTGNDSLSGYGDVQLNLKTLGRSVKDMVSALDGEGQIKVGQGYIKGINITDMMHNVAGAFTDGGSAGQNSAFTQMTASITIAKGIVTNHDLNMQVQELNITGEGNVNLPEYTINYHLVPKLQKTTQNAAGETTIKQGLAIPLIIEGSLDKPVFRPDLAAAAQQALQDPKQLKEQLRNSREVLKDQIKDPKEAVKNIKGLLKGFGR